MNGHAHEYTFNESPLQKVVLNSLSITVNWVDHIPNTHSCPISGVKNWDRDPAKPLGYPGRCGRICYITDVRAHFNRGYGLNHFKDTPLNIGSGSGNYYKGIFTSNYQINLFADDFVEMARRHYHQQTWLTISD